MVFSGFLKAGNASASGKVSENRKRLKKPPAFQKHRKPVLTAAFLCFFGFDGLAIWNLGTVESL